MPTSVHEQLQSSLGSSYAVERELGGGGMSRVFLAHERRLGRRVVVKVLSPELAAEVSAERFEREIRVAAQLQDPRIVPVLSAGDAGGLPFYTMPFIDGESLRSRMRAARLPVASAISILRDIALALEHAHARGVVHRDIKPENVLLSGAGAGAGSSGGRMTGASRVGTALVTDFGISKAIAAATTTTPGLTLTQHGVAIGTPAYMSPEQAAGDAVDHRADLYAWGVVAYEMLAGAHPFADRTTAAGLIAAHIAQPAPSLGATGAALPPVLVAIVERALAKSPDDRPASAAELVDALDQASRRSGAGVSRSTRWRLAAVAAVLVVVAAAALAVARRGSWWGDATTDSAPPTRSLAVLPFSNQSADSSDVYFAEGMSDELTTALGKLPTVRVVSRSSAARYRNVSAVEAARALRVEAVLEGKVRRANGRVRVIAALTSAADGVEMWSETYERQASDVFALQDDIARAIVSSLRVALGGTSAVAAAPRGTSDLEAYNLYLEGRYAWSRRGREGLLGAAEFYERAIARDSAFGRAYAGLAMTYTLMPLYAVAPADSVLPLAEPSAERAMAIDSTLVEAHLALANVRKMQWRWADAERHFRAAVALSPSDATAHQWYGTYLYALGRTDESVAQLLQARDLDPVSPGLGTDVQYGLYAARRFDEALLESRRAVALDTTLAMSQGIEGLVFLALGRPDSAVRALERTRTLGPAPDVRGGLARAYRALGRTHEANAEYASLVRSYRAGEASGYDMAVGAVAMGDLSAAMAAVKRVIDRRESLVTEYSLPCDPLLDPLKSRPEFERLLTGVGMRVCPPEPPRRPRGQGR